MGNIAKNAHQNFPELSVTSSNGFCPTNAKVFIKTFKLKLFFALFSKVKNDLPCSTILNLQAYKNSKYAGEFSQY